LILEREENSFKSNGERALQRTQFQSIKEKEDFVLSAKDLINDQFVLLQSGKKNYFVVGLFNCYSVNRLNK
jgi:tyrosyl-tRNA synthetase